MPLLLSVEAAVFGTSIPLRDFETLLAAHARKFSTTGTIEAQGQGLLAQDIPESQVADFVAAVCDWGGYSGIGGRVLKRNKPAAIANALRQAGKALSGSAPDFAAALAHVNALNSLGSPSFASKHLRFLWPSLCPVFDSLLQEALPYSFDTTGYGEFASDCVTLADKLTSLGEVPAHRRTQGRWFAADVEAAVYAFVTDLR